MPELRVGTLDSLLALSDDLVKVNNLVEAVTQKIKRQVIDLASTETEVSSRALDRWCEDDVFELRE